MDFTASVCLVTHNKKILLLLRDDRPGLRDRNRWSLVGGLRDDNENPLETVKRELMEEIRIVPENIAFLGFIKILKNPRAVFHAELTNNEAKRIKLGNEGQELKFIRVKEMGKLELTEILGIYFSKYKKELADFVSGKEVNYKSLGLKK